jgi:outer membrane protein insertion porin family
MRKIIVCLLICCFVALPGFSQDSDEWYQGKIIKDITFTGLVNVKAKDLRAVTGTYKGKIFSDEIFWELQGKLHTLGCFDSMILHKNKAGRRDTDGVIIQIDVTEKNLSVSEIIFKGNTFFSNNRLLSFLETKGYEKGKILTGQIRLMQDVIEEVYHGNGFYMIETETTQTPKKDKTYTLTFFINEGYQYFVEDVQIKGNTVFSDNELKEYLIRESKGVCNTGRRLDTDYIADVDALDQYYKDRGYMQIDLNRNPDFKEVRSEGNIRFLIIAYNITNEGERHSWGGFEFSGNTVFSNAKLSALVQSRKGEVFNYSVVENDYLRILNLYYDAGYINVVIDRQLKTEGRVVSWHLSIDEGNKIYVENIIVRGNEKYTTEAILEKIPLKPGDVFSLKKIKEAQRNLADVNIVSYLERDQQTLTITVYDREGYIP